MKENSIVFFSGEIHFFGTFFSGFYNFHSMRVIVGGRHDFFEWDFVERLSNFPNYSKQHMLVAHPTFTLNSYEPRTFDFVLYFVLLLFKSFKFE